MERFACLCHHILQIIIIQIEQRVHAYGDEDDDDGTSILLILLGQLPTIFASNLLFFARTVFSQFVFDGSKWPKRLTKAFKNVFVLHTDKRCWFFIRCRCLRERRRRKKLASTYSDIEHLSFAMPCFPIFRHVPAMLRHRIETALIFSRPTDQPKKYKRENKFWTRFESEWRQLSETCMWLRVVECGSGPHKNIDNSRTIKDPTDRYFPHWVTLKYIK